MTKYHAKKTIINGITFDSKMEADYYSNLLIQLEIGRIKDLELQPEYELLPKFKKNGKSYRKTSYVADFKYYDNKLEKEVIVDVKGMETPVFKLKHKIFEYMYPNLELEIVKKWNKNF